MKVSRGDDAAGADSRRVAAKPDSLGGRDRAPKQVPFSVGVRYVDPQVARPLVA